MVHRHYYAKWSIMSRLPARATVKRHPPLPRRSLKVFVEHNCSTTWTLAYRRGLNFSETENWTPRVSIQSFLSLHSLHLCPRTTSDSAINSYLCMVTVGVKIEACNQVGTGILRFGKPSPASAPEVCLSSRCERGQCSSCGVCHYYLQVSRSGSSCQCGPQKINPWAAVVHGHIFETPEL